MHGVLTVKRIGILGVAVASCLLVFAGTYRDEPWTTAGGAALAILLVVFLLLAIYRRLGNTYQLVAAARDEVQAFERTHQEASRATLRRVDDGFTQARSGLAEDIGSAVAKSEAAIRRHVQRHASQEAVGAMHQAVVGSLERLDATTEKGFASQSAISARQAETIGLLEDRMLKASADRQAKLAASLEALGTTLGETSRELGASLSRLHEASGSQAGAASGLREDVERLLARQLELSRASTSLGLAVSKWEAQYRQDKQRFREFVRKEKLDIIGSSERSGRRVKTEVVREVEALDQLRRLLGVQAPTPLMGGWALDPVAMLNLVQFVLARKPSCIVELGGGTSTAWLGLALEHLGAGRLISFDHLPGYADATREAVGALGLTKRCDIRLAPLVPTVIDGKEYSWYDIADLESLGPIDLLLVDGPPATTGPLARLPAVPRLFSRLSPNASIVLDDTSRPDEVEIKQYWLEQYPELRPGEPLGARTEIIHRV